METCHAVPNLSFETELISKSSEPRFHEQLCIVLLVDYLGSRLRRRRSHQAQVERGNTQKKRAIEVINIKRWKIGEERYLASYEIL